MKIRFGTRTFTLGDKTDISSSNQEGVDGFRLKFSITKNKSNSSNRGGGFITFRYDTGVDKIGDLVETAKKFGYISKGGSWMTLTNPKTGEPLTYKDGTEMKFQGQNAVIHFLKEFPDFAEKYLSMLESAMNDDGSLQLLDDNDLAEILEQEKSVMNNIDDTEKKEIAELEKESVSKKKKK